mmetsp:Transcript_19936/g.60358  ORF Transcript_19936/g.60358 Transcript_19936/m.60358 type:complete len:251 (+) Transcript_19936:505-1257(+)
MSARSCAAWRAASSRMASSAALSLFTVAAPVFARRRFISRFCLRSSAFSRALRAAASAATRRRDISTSSRRRDAAGLAAFLRRCSSATRAAFSSRCASFSWLLCWRSSLRLACTLASRAFWSRPALRASARRWRIAWFSCLSRCASSSRSRFLRAAASLRASRMLPPSSLLPVAKASRNSRELRRPYQTGFSEGRRPLAGMVAAFGLRAVASNELGDASRTRPRPRVSLAASLAPSAARDLRRFRGREFA